MSKPSDIKILDVRTRLSRYDCRAPIKFGNCVTTDISVMEVVVRVRSRKFREAVGYGSMTRGIGWSFPADMVDTEKKVAAMDRLILTLSDVMPDLSGGEYLHPLDWGVLIETWIEKELQVIKGDMGLEAAIPLLAGLVAVSPFDAAIHDGFGRVNNMDCYNGYGKEFMNHDLSYYLDSEYSGEYPDSYIRSRPCPEMPLYHFVGALDALTDEDVAERVNDGRPETLKEWIRADGLTHLKLEMNGKDLAWDINRVDAVNRIAEEIEEESVARNWRFSLDFNEQCEHVDYLRNFLSKLQEQSRPAFERIQYIEQPMNRNLRDHPENTVHEADSLKPVVIDEALDGYERFLLSREMGYSGIALNACRGQSQALLFGVAAAKQKRFLCVQDLNCVSTSFMHSASLAAHIPIVVAVEGNGRRYCPDANRNMATIYPDVFTVRDGKIQTGELAGNGLCGVPEEYVRIVLTDQ